MIDGANLLQFIGDELVAFVEEQHAKLLADGEGLHGTAISSTLDHDDSTGRFFTAPRKNRAAAACTILNSVIAESPSPLTSTSRASGAAITSANEPNFSSSVLASGLTSRRGSARNSSSSSRQRVGAGLAKAVAQALAVAQIVRCRLGKAACAVALLFQHRFSHATSPWPHCRVPPQPAPPRMTGLRQFAIAVRAAV
jgi:hypothetical protein